jgi:hypothetical protein
MLRSSRPLTIVGAALASFVATAQATVLVDVRDHALTAGGFLVTQRMLKMFQR